MQEASSPVLEEEGKQHSGAKRGREEAVGAWGKPENKGSFVFGPLGKQRNDGQSVKKNSDWLEHWTIREENSDWLEQSSAYYILS